MAFGICDGNSDSETGTFILGGKINDGTVADNKIDRVSVIAHSNNFINGTVTLYGIKK